MSSLSHDTLPTSVPTLETSGKNWLLFSLRFTLAVKAKGKWGHFDGTKPRPEPPQAQEQAAEAAAGAAEEGGAAAEGVGPDPFDLEVYQELLAEWQKNEDIALYLLSQRLPDSTLVSISRYETCTEKWTAVTREYTEKSVYAQTSLRAEFLEAKMPEGADVREFLNELRTKRETLAQSGVNISDSDYRSTIISCLPRYLSNFASTQLTSAQISARNLSLLSGLTLTAEQFERAKYVDPEVLIHIIVEESERLKRNKRSDKSVRTNRPPRDQALAVTHLKPLKPRPKNPPQPPRVCWTCGEPGHLQRKCPKNKGGSAKPNSGQQSKPKESANYTIDSDSDGVWDCANMAREWSDDEDDDFMPVESKHCQEDECSFTEGDFEPPVDEGDHWNDSSDLGLALSDDWTEGLTDDESEGCEDFVELTANVNFHGKEPDTQRRAILDSGSTRHIAPYRGDFTKFESIAPRALASANKQIFHATGQGSCQSPYRMVQTK